MIPMENETSDMMIAERVLLQEDAVSFILC